MALFHNYVGLSALCTATAGVVLFALAEHLPTPFPSSVTRLVGIWCMLASLFPLWAVTDSWKPPALVGGACLAGILLAHVLQTRTPAVAPLPRATSADGVENGHENGQSELETK